MTRNSPRILVVEGEPIIRMTIRDTLIEAGYEVMVAPNGSRALGLLDDPDHVDLVVTAIMLSGADGIEIARSARTHGKAVPIVFESGHSSRLADASAPAPFRRLAKPYNMEALRAAVDELLDHHDG